MGGEITREDIKEKLNTDFEVNIDKESGDIAFITYQKGEAEAKIRFKVENYGKTLMEKLEKAEKIVIKDMEVKPSLLEGEEEDQFLADSLRDLKNQKQNKNHRERAANRTMVGSGSSAKIKRPDQPVYTPAFLYNNGGSSLWSIHIWGAGNFLFLARKF